MAWPVTFVLVALLAGGQSASQRSEVTEVVDAGPCSGCNVTLTERHSFFVGDGERDLGPSAAIAIDGRGRLYVTSRDRQRVLLFTGDGQFARAIGRTGRGPGEIGRVLALGVGIGDSLLIVDDARRLSVMDPEKYEVRRALQLVGSAARAVLTIDGSVVVQSTIPSPSAAGYPVHLIAADGRIAKSFGVDDDETFVATCTYCSRRDLGTSLDPQRVWLSRANQYDFEQWTVSGQRIASFRVRNSSWFRSWTTENRWRHGSEPRQTTLMGVHSLAPNMVCIIGSRAAPGWHHMDVPVGSGIELHPAGGIIGPPTALDEFFFDVVEQNTESVIDCLDLDRKRVIATTTVRGNLRLLRGSTAAKVVRDKQGNYGITLYSLTVVTR